MGTDVLCFSSRFSVKEKLSIAFFRAANDFQWERTEQDTEIRDYIRSFRLDRLLPIPELDLYRKTQKQCHAHGNI